MISAVAHVHRRYEEERGRAREEGDHYKRRRRTQLQGVATIPERSKTLDSASRVRFPLLIPALPTRKSTLTGNEHSRSRGCPCIDGMKRTVHARKATTTKGGDEHRKDTRKHNNAYLRLPALLESVLHLRQKMAEVISAVAHDLSDTWFDQGRLSAELGVLPPTCARVTHSSGLLFLFIHYCANTLIGRYQAKSSLFITMPTHSLKNTSQR